MLAKVLRVHVDLLHGISITYYVSSMHVYVVPCTSTRIGYYPHGYDVSCLWRLQGSAGKNVCPNQSLVPMREFRRSKMINLS